eukprot:GHVU01132752.1.p1 GENE.GHVU01132752.1~~GHVU01132752.1.p1  ORF type:complete len:109 (-),score=1.00 GHVU01132752.1:33-359(-)
MGQISPNIQLCPGVDLGADTSPERALSYSTSCFTLLRRHDSWHMMAAPSENSNWIRDRGKSLRDPLISWGENRSSSSVSLFQNVLGPTMADQGMSPLLSWGLLTDPML